MTTPIATPSDILLEDLVLVFYVRPHSQFLPGRFVRECLISIFASLDVPKGSVSVSRRWPQGPHDERWQKDREGRSEINIPSISKSDHRELDRLLDLPLDVESVDAESNSRGSTTGRKKSWTFLHTPALPTVEGQPDHRFVLALRTGLFRGDDDPAATSVVNALISTAATHPGLYHAHVEIGNEYEAQGGLYYAGVTAIPFPPWYRCLNDAVWWNPRTDRQRLVRGVYWGTYLSPDMARRFDPDGKTAEAFLSYKDHPNFEHSQYIIRLENGGMFIALTGNPLHMCDQPNSVADLSLGLAAWLQHTLRERQMLA